MPGPAAAPLADLSRWAIHTQTNKPRSLKQCIEAYSAAGVGGVRVRRLTGHALSAQRPAP